MATGTRLAAARIPDLVASAPTLVRSTFSSYLGDTFTLSAWGRPTSLALELFKVRDLRAALYRRSGKPRTPSRAFRSYSAAPATSRSRKRPTSSGTSSGRPFRAADCTHETGRRQQVLRGNFQSISGLRPISKGQIVKPEPFTGRDHHVCGQFCPTRVGLLPGANPIDRAEYGAVLAPRHHLRRQRPDNLRPARPAGPGAGWDGPGPRLPSINLGELAGEPNAHADHHRDASPQPPGPGSRQF